jgi:predicted TIM-barrel enzyme
VDVRQRLEDFNMQFAEARDLINDAKESLGTTDYSDDAQDAIEATKAAIGLYKGLLTDLDAAGSGDKRKQIELENGQKMKQLEAELQEVLEHDED